MSIREGQSGTVTKRINHNGAEGWIRDFHKAVLKSHRITSRDGQRIVGWMDHTADEWHLVTLDILNRDCLLNQTDEVWWKHLQHMGTSNTRKHYFEEWGPSHVLSDMTMEEGVLVTRFRNPRLALLMDDD